MSEQHPVIAITGASGAGTTSVQQAFKEIFFRQSINAHFVQGDSFLRHTTSESEALIAQNLKEGRHLTCYGPELNDLGQLERCFKDYSQTGECQTRDKVTWENHHLHQATSVGGFTPWQASESGSDCLFYEGLHGGVVANTWTRRKADRLDKGVIDRRGGSKGADAAQYVDLLIGVVPAINLEWIQRIHHERTSSKRTAMQTTVNIIEQLPDYIHFIVPQFSITDINFQRMPVVDTSNPFEPQPVPVETESVIVISFKEPAKHDLQRYLKRIDGAFMSRRDTLVIPGGQMQHALDVICAPLIEALM